MSHAGERTSRPHPWATPTLERTGNEMRKRSAIRRTAFCTAGRKKRSTDSSPSAQNDRVVAWFFSVWGATTRRANRSRMATAGGRRPPLPHLCGVFVGAAFGRPARRRPLPSVILSVPTLSFFTVAQNDKKDAVQNRLTTVYLHVILKVDNYLPKEGRPMEEPINLTASEWRMLSSAAGLSHPIWRGGGT